MAIVQVVFIRIHTDYALTLESIFVERCLVAFTLSTPCHTTRQASRPDARSEDDSAAQMGHRLAGLTRHLGLWLGLVLMLVPLAQALASTETQVRQAWQLLEYIAVDYEGAVVDGEVVDAGEYEEMREFSATARDQIAALPDVPGRDQLQAQVRVLIEMIEHKADASVVAETAHGLATDLFATYAIVAAPAQPPDMTSAPDLYALHCASCHGTRGQGDGPAAAGLEPPPIAFTDAARAAQRSPLALYEVISQGLDGTSMASYGALPESERWALAFHVAGLAYSEAERTRGGQLWTTDGEAKAALPSLDALVGTSQQKLATQLGEDPARAILAWLYAQPEAVVPVVDDVALLAVARSKMQESLTAYRAGDAKAAQTLALAAYLDGVEPIEPMLAVRDRKLLREIEAAMAQLRSNLREGAPVAQVEASAEQIETLFGQADAVLHGGSASPAAAFLGSFTILVREGLEALLIVIGMIAFLRKARRRDALRWVHMGWVGALLAGLVTWALATWMIDISGAQRELTEGLSALFAALVLLSVGIWMHQKSMAGRWQEYLQAKLSAAMTRRSAWFLFLLSFVAVYREVFETILFYVAMWNPQDATAVIAGFVAGIVVLVVIAYALLRLGARLPIGTFFSWSSLLIAVLAVVLVGKGVAALQEAGWIGESLVAVPRIDLLGIYPTWQSISAQLVMLIAAMGGFWVNARSAKRAVAG